MEEFCLTPTRQPLTPAGNEALTAVRFARRQNLRFSEGAAL